MSTARQHIGAMDVICGHCSARFFKSETHHCCSNGAVELPLWRQPPEPLLSLLRHDDFRTKIRGYNCAMSLGSSVFDDLTSDYGPATFKMAGRSWRLLPRAIDPSDAGTHKTAQIYTLPVMEATDRRSVLTSHAGRSSLRADWLTSLHTMLQEHNALVRSFVQSWQVGADWSIDIGALDPQAANDTMVGLLVNGGAPRATTVIPLHSDGSLIILPDLDPFYQPIHFVLLFPYGDPQWGMHLNRVKDNARKRVRAHTPVSIFDYLKFHIQRRVGDVTSIHAFGRLFEEWFVDCFLQGENHKLKWVKFNQSKFRSEKRTALHRQLFDAVPPRQIGSPATHLPSSFVRGNRHFRELYADAMRLPAKFGGIDYFLTFTTNPSWPEIVENAAIANGMNSPDLYCRVFHLKMKALLTDILHNGVLGVVVAYSWAVEFQQRGLPHLHALFIVRPEDKPHSPEVVDAVVAAQLPDAVSDPDYFACVTKHMIHGPCGSLNPKHYCMKAGSCRFDYPKRLQSHTTIPADGYTQLARPLGPTARISATFVADNSWVVPHNRFLLCKYDAHINLECSASVQVVKYMFSYVYKGSKSSSASVRADNDEIRQFSEGRITSSAEAIWQVLRFDMHGQSPSVQRLGCSLPGDPVVQFDPADQPDDIALAADQALCTTAHLMMWFALNRVDAFAKTLLYVEIPEFYVWVDPKKGWVRRKTKSQALGRIYPVDPTNREASAFRVLLLHARGCTSEADIRTVFGEERPTFFEAAIAAGLMEDDREFHACLSSNLLSALQLRSVFLIIILHCQPREPMVLLRKFFEELTDDFDGSYDRKMSLLLQFCSNNVDVPLDYLGLDGTAAHSAAHVHSTAFLESFVSNPVAIVDCSALNADQLWVHDSVIADIEQKKGTIFTLMAPAGTGKTFLIGAVLSTARQRQLRVSACATSALAASLYGHARTAHALFKIPVNQDEDSMCKPSATYKNWLRSISCFIWDEISMAHKWALDAVDRLLRDIHGVQKPFGGVTIIFAGDLRQLLPVHRFARDPSVYCLKMCDWFSMSVPLHLTVNIRAGSDPAWSAFVEQIGLGSPAEFPLSCVVPNVDALIAAVWPNEDFLLPGSRSILTMTRQDANMINTAILAKFPGVTDYSLSRDDALVRVMLKHTLSHMLTLTQTLTLKLTITLLVTLTLMVALTLLRTFTFRLKVSLTFQPHPLSRQRSRFAA